jgi:hypothetical protein
VSIAIGVGIGGKSRFPNTAEKESIWKSTSINPLEDFDNGFKDTTFPNGAMLVDYVRVWKL